MIVLKILTSGKEKKFDSVEKMLTYYTEYSQPYSVMDNQLIRAGVVVGIFE